MKHLLTVLFLCTQMMAGAQSTYYTKAGTIRFESKAPLENIEAIHRSVTSVLDASTGRVQFSVLMRGFEFHKSLMQQHFNENYVESDKYPKANFSGKVDDNQLISYSANGSYNVQAKGELTIHGVSRPVSVPGKLLVENGLITIQAQFAIILSEYNISIPALVKEKISKEVSIVIHCRLQPLKKD